ncbi:hypothetical protein ACHAWF_018831 [Thalassiosira exigua]
MAKLDTLCFASGNLKSSLETDRERPRTHPPARKTHRKSLLRDRKYLERAEKISTNVIYCRGVLNKGVGLCHDISGNAYCFLAMHRGRKMLDHSSSEMSKLKGNEWLQWAHHFAAFAIYHVREMFHVPDRSYTLCKGITGLIMLLRDFHDPVHMRFPCFEPRT